MHSLFLVLTMSRVGGCRFLANQRTRRSNEARIASVTKAAALDPMSDMLLNTSSSSTEILRLATCAMKMASIAGVFACMMGT